MRFYVPVIRVRFVTVAGATFFLLGVLFIWLRDNKQGQIQSFVASKTQKIHYEPVVMSRKVGDSKEEQVQSFMAPDTQKIHYEPIAIPRKTVGDSKKGQMQSFAAPKTQSNTETQELPNKLEVIAVTGNTKTQELPNKLEDGTGNMKTQELQTKLEEGAGNMKTQELSNKLEEGAGPKTTEVLSDKTKGDSAIKKENTTSQRQKAKTQEVPCGQICSYIAVRKNGKYYPYIEKQVDCNNLLFRMGNPQAEPEYPPPRSPPSRMYNAFTQNGDCPITGKRYMVEFSPKEEVVRVNITADTMAMLTRRDGYGNRINSYPDSQLLRDVLHRLKRNISGKRALVIGTIRPWLEAMLVNLDASHVTTSEYTPMHIDHPKILAKHPKEVAKDIMSGRVQPFDFIVSFSSIEHSGLGRYGDLLNPYGDLEAVAQVWCMIKPGGIFILGLPLSEDGEECSITWNAHRIYGYSRLQHVTANWEVLEINHPKDRKLDIHAVLVLKKASWTHNI